MADDLTIQILRAIQADLGSLKQDMASFREESKVEFAEVKADLRDLKADTKTLALQYARLERKVDDIKDQMGTLAGRVYALEEN